MAEGRKEEKNMKRALVFTFIIAMLLGIASFAEENTVFVTLEGKGHNPNYTESAVKLKDEFFAIRDEKLKSGALDSAEAKADFVNSFDWVRMTEQDETVFSQIFEFLKS